MMQITPFSKIAPLAFALVALAAAAAFAEETFQPKFKPTIHISRAEGSIRIDGELDDPGWVGVAKATGFAEVSPGDQIKPHVESEAWITYDENHLYVVLLAFDNPDDVRVSLRERDNIFSDDYFGLMIDTYGDQAWGYELFVNPIGIQGDLRMVSGGNEDMAFDVVWESRGKVTDKGYQVEIAIPFASLRFPNAAQQTWRINFWRDQQRELRRRFAWAARDRSNPCFMCDWGTLTGIENIRPASNVDVIASAIGTQSGELSDGDDPYSGFSNDNAEMEGAVNLRYGISSNSSLELAINPDFSQIESDAGQIDVNQTFALFFPETRPFFQEGGDLFNTWIDAVYTRSINNPDVAGKFTGQFGSTSLLYTFAHDDNAPMILPFEEQSEYLQMEDATSNIVRVRHNLWDDSYVGGLYTDRRIDGGGAGTVISNDARIRFTKTLHFELQGALSRTEEPDDTTLTSDFNGRLFDGEKHTADFDGEQFWGHALYASLERNGRYYGFDLDYWEWSPTFRTDNGFTTRNDNRQASIQTGLSTYPNGKYLIQFNPAISIGRLWNLEGRFKDEWVRPMVFMELPYQTNVNLNYLFSRERFSDEVFSGIRRTNLWMGSRFNEMIGMNLEGGYGQTIYRDFDDPQMGDQTDISLSMTIKPSQRLLIRPSWSYSTMDSRRDGSKLYEGYILRTRFTYTFTREWNLRLVTQYDEFDDRFDVEPLITYKLNPFTVFYAGSGSSYNYYDRFVEEDEDGKVITDQKVDDWKLANRQFFAKVQYLYRF